MPEPFKNLINPALVRACGDHLQRAWRDFDRRGFERLALHGLGELEMKARAMQIADALEATLPDDFDRAAGVIETALAPAAAGDEIDFRITDAGLAGWIGWPLGEFIARRGQAMPERGLQALHALTQRFTGEFAIRPYLVNHFARTLDTLSRWQHDPSAHVRRLVSEGSRPRLPWGLQLKSLIADPSPTLPLLEALLDDPSEYVRRSVANHLNDIAKDHPHVVAEWLERHLPDAPPERRALLKHASRTLVKRGDRRVLAAWGLATPLRGSAEVRVVPAAPRRGGTMTIEVVLRATGARPQRLVVDYALRRGSSDGSENGARGKVWKGWALELAGGEARTLRKQHSWRPVTTRVDRPGPHVLELLVNGRAVARAPFTLRP